MPGMDAGRAWRQEDELKDCRPELKKDLRVEWRWGGGVWKWKAWRWGAGGWVGKEKQQDVP